LGIELVTSEAERAVVAAPRASVCTDDFFSWFGTSQWGQWDGVAGNPPFIRFQHWTEPTRSQAFDVMRMVGMRPTKLTNSWAPFVVASSLALRPGGRLGLVLPAELLQVTYASQLRGFLADEFKELTVITFKELVFQGVLQEVVLLLGVRGDGPARIRVIEVQDTASLPSSSEVANAPRAPALKHESEKWTKYFLDPREIAALRVALSRPDLLRLADLGEVDVGIVTGRNQFFVLRPSAASERSLERHVIPLVSKSAHLRGVRFDPNDLASLAEADAPCRLLAVDDDIQLNRNKALRTYVTEGEAEGVHKGYKCSIRKRWWVVPSVWTPDAFLLRQIYDHPRIVANVTAATSTDTIHRMRTRRGIGPELLAAASVNSLTFAFSEVMGRSYGGGVLELEPREAEALPFPDPRPLQAKDVARVDQLLRKGDLVSALDHVDARLLSDFDPDLIGDLRKVWIRLRDRRLARGRSSAQAA
jgi:adenine-specific DNA methylase